MKPAQIFHQYIWIINTLRAYRKLTLDELNQKWQEDGVADGNPLSRASFNRHRDAIQDMFGIIIDCDPSTYKYYISNEAVLSDDSIRRWLFSTLTVHGVLADSAAVKERLVLENAPAGEQYLNTIIRAIHTNHRLHIGYRKFETEGYEKVVSPFALKLFHQRWYLLARTEEQQMRIYALDRMTMVELTDEPFGRTRGQVPVSLNKLTPHFINKKHRRAHPFTGSLGGVYFVRGATNTANQTAKEESYLRDRCQYCHLPQNCLLCL